ncbi:MAG: GIY-YIG nuclease family protein, partial [Cyanobacteria bacterium J06649_4]
MTTDRQAFLLSDSAMQAASYSTYENFRPQRAVGLKELKAWKQRIVHFQQNLSPEAEQGSLFDVGPVATKPQPHDTQSEANDLDPFALRRQNTEFWRWQFDDVGVAAMYFVIDYATTASTAPVLLYVGETVKSN